MVDNSANISNLGASRHKTHSHASKSTQETSGSKCNVSTIIRLGLCLSVLAVVSFFIHHQLQILYFRTCRANLLAVVLHQRSDICYSLDFVILMIERGYQQGIAMIMQLSVSSSAIMFPYIVSSIRTWTSRDVKGSTISKKFSWWPFASSRQKRNQRLSRTDMVPWKPKRVSLLV